MAPKADQSLEPNAQDLGIPQEDPNVTIDLDEREDPDDEEGGDREPAAASSDRGPTERVRDPKTGKWAQKKRERGEDRRAAQSWRTEKTQFEQRLKTMQEQSERQMREMQLRLDNALRAPAPGQQQVPADPFAAPLADVQQQLAAELKLIEKDPAYGYERYMALQDKKAELIAQRTWARNSAANERRAPQQQPQNNRYAAREPIIESEYPWTMDQNNADLVKKAVAYKQYLVAAEGRLDTIDTDREALTWAATKFGAQFGIQPPPAGPTQRTRDFYAGPAQRTAPRRGDAPAGQIEVPRALVNGSGLSPAALARAIRGE